MAKESAIAGPELVAATVPVRTKMPAPMITPTPKTIRSRVPRVFLSLCSGSSVSAIDCSTDLVRNTFMAANLGVPPRGSHPGWCGSAGRLEGLGDQVARPLGELVGGDVVVAL